MRLNSKFHLIFMLLAVIIQPVQLSAQEKSSENETEELKELMEEGMQEIDFYSLEELLDVEVEVASLFSEDELIVGSTVSNISSHKWKQLGARRLHETLMNEMSVFSAPTIGGIYAIAVRGFTNSESMQGIATIIDGVPVNLILLGTSFGGMPNCELGILDRIEMIKGPGSSIYGSDAFHGVLLLKTFESNEDHYSAEIAGGYSLYGDANIKLSQGLWDNSVRFDAAAGASHQGEQSIEYEYNDNGIKGKGVRDNTYNSGSGVYKIRINPLGKLKVNLNAYVTYFDCDKFPSVHEGSDPMGNVYNLRDKDLSSNLAKYYIGSGTISYKFDNGVHIDANCFYSTSDLEYTLMSTTTNSITQFGDMYQRGAEIKIKQQDNPINLQWLIAGSYKEAELIGNSFTYKSGENVLMEGDLPGNGFSRNIGSIFTQLKWGAVKKQLYVLFGARLDDYSDSGSDITPKDFGLQISPRCGIIFLPTEKSSLKALYGRAFKAPIQLQLFGFPYLVDGNPDLKPETIDVFELIYMLKGKTWKADITGFYSIWKNAIIAERPPGTLGFFTNKGKMIAYGGELNIFGSIEPFSLELGFSYVMSKALDANDPFQQGKNKDIIYATFPEYSVHAGLHYFLKAISIDFYLNNILYFKMKDTYSEIKQHPESLPTYHRMDLNISKIISKKIELYINIRNLLNKENKVSSIHGADQGYPEPGIGVMLRAGYKF